jgi:hypothetical protein
MEACRTVDTLFPAKQKAQQRASQCAAAAAAGDKYVPDNGDVVLYSSPADATKQKAQ